MCSVQTVAVFDSTCVCTCVCVFDSTCVCTCVFDSTFMCSCVCVFVSTCVCTCVCVFDSTCVCTCVFDSTCVCTCVCVFAGTQDIPPSGITRPICGIMGTIRLVAGMYDITHSETHAYTEKKKNATNTVSLFSTLKVYPQNRDKANILGQFAFLSHINFFSDE